MHETYTLEMRSKLLEYIGESKRSRVQIARELGISQAALSQFLNDNYPGNNEEIALKTERFLTMGNAKKALAKAPEISLAVRNTESILQKTFFAHSTNDILLVYGPAGCGKSTALKHYAATNNGVIYVEADVTTNSYRSILFMILDEMGESVRGSTSYLMRYLIGKLKNTGKLIIIDEAQHLTEKCFDALRALNDRAGISLVYAGNPSILKRMEGKRAEDYDQVYSRIGYYCELDNRYSLDDIGSIFEGFSLSNDVLKALYQISQHKGGLRRMVKQYRLAANIAAISNDQLSLYHLEEAGKRIAIR